MMMMLSLFVNFLKKRSDKETREIILKEFLNPKNQKKAIKEAARKSAQDQNAILAKYRQLMKQS